MYKLLSIVLLFATTSIAYGQNYTIDGADITDCNGNFLDAGGNGNYGNNEYHVITICPDNPGSQIQLDFTMFDVEANFDFLCVYDGTSTAATTLGCYDNNVPLIGLVASTDASGCLTFEFDSDGSVTDPGWTAAISCTQPCQSVIADPTFGPAPDIDGVIRLCQGDNLSLTGDAQYPDNNTGYTQSNGTSTFDWIVQDNNGPTTYTGQNQNVAFPNSGIYVIQLDVTDVEGCESANAIDQYVYVSTTPIFDGMVIANDPICLGDQNTLTGGATEVLAEYDCTPPVSGLTPLPDGSGVSYSTSVTVDCYGPGQVLTHQNQIDGICINMEHSYAGDLEIAIECPDGTQVILVDYPNGLGNAFIGEPVDNTTGDVGNGYQYCFTPTPTYGTWAAENGNHTYTFTDNIGTNYNNVEYLPPGDYASENSLGGLNGCPLNGDWSIIVTDNLGADDGYIFDWQINFNPLLTPAQASFIPNIVSDAWQADPTIVSGTNPIVVEPTATGNACYTYEVTDDFGCTYDTTICFTVVPTPILDPIADVTVCSSYTLPAISGTDLSGNQAYFSGPNGMGTQYAPGAAITTSGTYYAYDATNGPPVCTDEVSFNITILDPPVVDDIPNVTACDSYTFPVITGTNLTGNEAYYTASGGIGTQYLPGDVITATDQIYIWDETGTTPNCFDQEIFIITINLSPDAGTDVVIPLCDNSGAIDLDNSVTGDAGGNWTVTSGAPGGNFNSATGVLNPTGLNGTFTFDYTVVAAAPCINDVAVFTVNIDGQDPVINCPGNLTAVCDISEQPAYATLAEFTTAGGTATDETSLDAASFTLLSEVSDNNSCPEIVTRTYQIADDCGHTSTCAQTITIDDNVNPTGTAPADVNVECAVDVPAANPALITDEADNCGIQSVVHIGDVSDNNTCPETITRTYRITDLCGNFIDVTQNIIIEDVTDPVFNAPPADVTVECVADVPAMTNLNYTDNCDPAGSVAGVDGALTGGSCGGTITRTWTYTDACGNTATATQTITVDDTTDPTASNPADINVECAADVPAADPTVVTDEADNCTANPVVAFVSDVSDNNTCPETITRTYSVTDDCGNSINVTQNIIIEDVTDPVFNAPPADVTVECVADVPAMTNLNYTDNCDPAGSVAGVDGALTGGSCGGTITRTWTYTDACGNTATATQTITVDDTTDPTASNPADINVECAADVPAADPTVVTDEADNCTANPVVAFVSDVSDNNTCPETITRTYSVTDDCGNSINVTQNIIIEDVTDPVFNAPPADVTVECVADVPAMTNLNYTDNCDPAGSVAGVDGALTGGSCGGTITRTWTYTDACGNTATATQTITVDDTTDPTASNPADINVECAADVPAADPTVVTDEADNCTANPVVAFVSDVSDNNTCPETITRTYSVTDDCGNSINVTQNIIIEDVTDPVFNAPPADVTVECVADVPAMTNLNYTDNCDPAGSVAGVDGALTGGSCGGTITRTWTYTDACGNTATTSQTITIDDTTDPTASNPANINITNTTPVPAPDVTVVTDEADNCTANPTVAWVSDVSDNGSCPETITRTYSVTDDCGNTINVVQLIIIGDAIMPTASNPANINVECITDVPAADPAVVTDEADNGAPPVVALFSEVTDGNSCPETITRTYSVTDDCGNTIYVSHDIIVEDVTDPTASNPADINIECVTDVPAPDVTVVTDEADNCGTPTVAFVSDVSDGNSCPETITRTYSVTDSCGNSINVTQNIIILDVTDPTASNPADINVECITDVPAADPAIVNDEADNCGTPTVAFVSDASDGNSCPETITRTYSVTDSCGNSINVTQNIIINDVTDPTASNPADINVECITDVPAADPTVVTDEADNCGTPTVAFVSDVSDGNSCPETITRTYSVTDSCGNSINVTQSIIINDVTDPTASNPADINIECVTDLPAPDVTVVTDEADNCGTPTVAFVSDVSDGNTCPETISRTYSVTDSCGNSITVVQNIIINDVTDPTASNPADINVQCAADVPAPDVTVVTDEADNCGTPTVAFVSDVSDMNTCPETITRTYSVTDSCGNSINVTQNIIINDTQAPTGTAPAAVNVECVTAVPAADPALITDEADNCTANPTVIHLSDVSDGNSCPETITRTYRITDDCGNITDVFQTITINDVTPPTASNPAQTIVPGGPAPAPDPTVVTDEADNCGTPTVAFVSQVSDNNPCPETITYTYSVTDSCGNSINVTHEVLITDPIAPTGTAPADLAVECIDLVPAPDATLIVDEADNNGVPTVAHLSDVSDGNTCPETITRTYRITDACANFTDVVQLITVHDLTDPTASNPADINVQCAADVPAPDVTVVTDEADNCGTPTVAFVSDVSDMNTCPETITRTYSVTDSCGNSINVTQNIIINDTQAPTGTAPAAVNVECVTAVPAADPALITDEADNCTANPTVIHLSDVSDGNSCPETITRTYRITDDCGNITDVFQTITINDVTPPTASNPAQTIVPGGPAPAPDPTVVTDEADNCGTPTVAFVSQVSDNNPCPETITYTYSVTDSCGNSINVTHEVLITDPFAPTGTAPADIAVECIDLVPAPDATLIVDEADNNGVPTVAHLSDVSDGNTCPETITRTYRITDACANFTDVVQLITVHDLTDPTASNPADINVQCAADVPVPDVTVVTDEADNCGTPTVAFVSDVSDMNTCPETITRTYSVTDSCGNSINVTQNIIIDDTTDPVGTAPGAVNVECITDVPAANIADVTGVSDNCTANPVVAFVSDVSDGNSCPETITRTYSVTDDCGNQILLTQDIIINDVTPPTASNPADIIVPGGPAPAADPTVVTDEADNCGTPTVAFVSDVSDNNPCPETIVRTYSVTDSCGNSINVTQNIIITDPIAPTGTAPADVAVECIDLVPAPDATLIVDEADNNGVPTVAHLSDVSDGNTCPETITRTYRITDLCGNITDVTQLITVHDLTDPTASNPGDINVECVADVPAPDVTVVTDEADNCGTPTVAFVSDVSDMNTCPETITRTYSVTDSCGNSINVTQNIIINDVTPPTGTAPAAITVQCVGDVPADDVALITDEADNCTANPTVTFIGDASDGNTCPEIITRTYRITDDCGNFTDVTQTITVNDDIDPTASNPAPIAVSLITDVPAPNVIVVTDEADNCTANPLVAWVSDVSDNNACPETITRTYSVTDDCGNQITVEQTITVQDLTPPTASNPAATNVECITDVPAVDPAIVIDEADNSGVANVAFVSESSDGNTCPETITRVYSVTDDCGNQITVDHVITVQDITDPTASNPGDINVECVADVPAPDVTVVTDEADNCGTPTVAFVSDVSDMNTCPETITRTYSVTDSCGNSINVTQNIIINDVTPPTGTAPAAITVQCIGDVPADDVALITDEADNCTANPTVTFIGDASDGNTCPEIITRTYRITDDCGNFTDVTQTITVNDDINPTASNPASVTVAVITDVPAPDVTVVTDEADNCTANPVVVHVGDVSDGNTCPETITRTYSVTDDCGNQITVDQIIIVSDTQAPTASNPLPVNVQCIGDVPAVDVNVVTDEADNSGLVPVVAHVSDVSDGNTCPEVITRTYSVTDACGNFINVTQTITVNDDILPTASNALTTNVECIGDVPAVDVNVITDEADNCTAAPLVAFVSEVSDGNTCPETITRTYSVTDDCGNSIDVTHTIIVNDVTLPTASAPAAIAVQCIGDVPAPDVTVVTDEADNCTANPLVAHVSDVSDGNTCPETITRTYSITDDCGNQITVDQIITVNDDQLPTASNPIAVNVECIGDVPAPDVTVVTDEADNCTANPIVVHVSDVSDGNTCPEVITRTYSVTDDCGNSINVTQTITVNDVTLPTASNPAPINVSCAGDIPLADPTVVTDEADNCTAAPVVAFVSDVSDGNVCNGEVVTRTYSVTDDCGNQIFVTQQINIAVVTPPVNAGLDVGVCEDVLVTLTAENPDNATITWDNGVTDGVAFYPPLGTTTYTVIASQCGGECFSTDDVDVTVHPTPVINFSGDDLYACEPHTVTFTNQSTEQFDCVWDFGDGNIVQDCGPVSNTYMTAGLYDVTLTVTSDQGCTATDTYNDYIEVVPFPVAAFSFSPTELDILDTEVEFTNESMYADSYTWSFGDFSPQSNETDPTHVFPDAAGGSYTVSLIAASNAGCQDQVNAVVTIDDVLLFYVPNVFTPDGNSINNTFFPVFTAGYDPYDYHLSIFNRWGELIFESYNAGVGWDGTYGNELVQDGVYVWQIEFGDTMSDERHRHRGHVTVLK